MRSIALYYKEHNNKEKNNNKENCELGNNNNEKLDKRLGIAYSISSCKSFIHNAYMLERFICVFGINPDPQVIDKLFKELILFTARAA